MAQVRPSAVALRPATPSQGISFPPPVLSQPQLAGSLHPLSSYKTGHLTLDTFSPVNKGGSFEFDRVIKSGKVNRRLKRKGAWKPSWKPVILVLRPNLLSIYQNEDESGLRASITLSDVTAVAPVKKTHTENVFGVFSSSSNYHFQGLSARDTADWIERIRSEASVDVLNDAFLPSPTFPSGQNAMYDSTDDPSAGEDEGTPNSPERIQSQVRGPKNRSRGSITQNRASHINEHSGNELYTSHSDFSDVPIGSLPKSAASSLLYGSMLSPIASDQNIRPQMARNASQMSGLGVDPPIDPERVIRQGWLQILKAKGGVKQWKTLWVVLRPRALSFYKNEQEYSTIKLVSMSSIIDIAEIDPISRSKSFCFQIILEDKTYRCCTPDEEALAKWLGSVKSVLAKRQDRRSLADATAGMSLR